MPASLSTYQKGAAEPRPKRLENRTAVCPVLVGHRTHGPIGNAAEYGQVLRIVQMARSKVLRIV